MSEDDVSDVLPNPPMVRWDKLADKTQKQIISHARSFTCEKDGSMTDTGEKEAFGIAIEMYTAIRLYLHRGHNLP